MRVEHAPASGHRSHHSSGAYSSKTETSAALQGGVHCTLPPQA